MLILMVKVITPMRTITLIMIMVMLITHILMVVFHTPIHLTQIIPIVTTPTPIHTHTHILTQVSIIIPILTLMNLNHY